MCDCRAWSSNDMYPEATSRPFLHPLSHCQAKAKSGNGCTRGRETGIEQVVDIFRGDPSICFLRDFTNDESDFDQVARFWTCVLSQYTTRPVRQGLSNLQVPLDGGQFTGCPKCE
jgi:hypothetical protein